ncbi:MAG: hypothetical protein MUE73_10350 [Planctomycetes bacterium]|nr:hypothetical protein [Planctomycetota bacterium]
MERTTILPAAGVLLLLLVAGALALPDRTAARLAAADARAVRTLGEVAMAQVVARSLRLIDRDGDGTGEFGFLPDLRRAGPGGGPLLAVSLEETARPGTLRGGGFLYVVLLPAADGSPVEVARAADVRPGLAAQTFLAFAWPEGPGRTGSRSYLVNHDLLVFESPVTLAPDTPPAPPPRLWTVDPFTGQSTLPPPAPAQWNMLLPEAQRTWYRDRFAAAGLPLPLSLAPPGH